MAQKDNTRSHLEETNSATQSNSSEDWVRDGELRQQLSGHGTHGGGWWQGTAHDARALRPMNHTLKVMAKEDSFMIWVLL